MSTPGRLGSPRPASPQPGHCLLLQARAPAPTLSPPSDPAFSSQPASAPRHPCVGQAIACSRCALAAPLPPMPPPRPSQPLLCSAEEVVTLRLLLCASTQVLWWPAPAFMPRVSYPYNCSRLSPPARVCRTAVPGHFLSSPLALVLPFSAPGLGIIPKVPF